MHRVIRQNLRLALFSLALPLLWLAGSPLLLLSALVLHPLAFLCPYCRALSLKNGHWTALPGSQCRRCGLDY